MCGVRNSHFTLRIEIVGAFPTHYCVGGLWPSLLGTGISYNKGYRLETVTLSEMFMLLHKNKMLHIPTFSSHFAYLLKEEASTLCIPTFSSHFAYLLKEGAHCSIHADHVDVHSTK
jgi:hypothetical protein